MDNNIIDIINKKRLGKNLTYSELYYAFNGYLEGTVKDYQMSSLLMAICLNDMNDQEIFSLTEIFIKSGDVLDFSGLDGIKVDKHSTGGVGDKTTLVVGPIVAACGVKMAKMSGRGLGFTGGTIDKLESIPGFNIELTQKEFVNQLNDINIAISSQTANLTPMDKKIYALRDVTGTVESIPLIAVSIMSKKISSGADKILIDIKLGNGALIKTQKEAKRLSDIVIRIGKKHNRETKTIITNMDIPLGRNIGNSLEVLESIDILDGKVNSYLSNICIELAIKLVSMGKNIKETEAKKQVLEVIRNKKALLKFAELIKYQKGKIQELKVSKKCIKIRSDKSGTIEKINAYKMGCISRDLGSGRIRKEDSIDYTVGIVLNKTLGTNVKVGDILCTLYINDNSKYNEKEVLECYSIQ